jgi:hypothetical protein
MVTHNDGHHVLVLLRCSWRKIPITLIESSEFARFHHGKGFVEGFQYFLALRFFKEIHRQALKPSLHFPRTQLSPIRADVSGNRLCGYSAARMGLSLVVFDAVTQLLRRREPESEGSNSHQDHFAWRKIRGSERGEFSFQMRATMDSVALAWP